MDVYNELFKRTPDAAMFSVIPGFSWCGQKSQNEDPAWLEGNIPISLTVQAHSQPSTKAGSISTHSPSSPPHLAQTHTPVLGYTSFKKSRGNSITFMYNI